MKTVRDCHLERGDGVLVRDGLEVLVQMVHQGSASGYVQLRDDVIGDVVEVLD